MSAARGAHTATLLPSGQVLVAGGNSSGGRLASAELYDPATRAWLPVNAMRSSRDGHTATLLPNGQVLIAGGRESHVGDVVASAEAELYDPATRNWQPVLTMSTRRHRHTATLLASGQVLIAGGFDSSETLASAELYDPAGRWAAAASMRAGRIHPTATLLPDHRVLVAGGISQVGYEASAELFDPATSAMGSWTSTCPSVDPPPHCAMSVARAVHTATLLESGQVLIAGGNSSGSPLASAELYDPAAQRWRAAGVMNSARAYHAAVLLSTGRVLVAGGWGLGGALGDAEQYDPDTGQWISSESMRSARWQLTATLLSSGKVLVVGGWGDIGARRDAELYDPSTGQWELVAGAMRAARTGHSATRLRTGHVLIAGGVGSDGLLALAELFDPATRTFSLAAPMRHARTGHGATALPDGRVLVAGGADTGGPLASVELYDPAKSAWQEVRLLATPRGEPAGLSLHGGTVLVLGGAGAGGIPLATAELFELFPDGALCGQATDCGRGSCVDGVCCNEACDGGPCDVCAVSTDIMLLPGGARTPGLCQPIDGVACDDGDACTEVDVCRDGACRGGTPVVCTATDDCHVAVGMCDSTTGMCPLEIAKAQGAECDDGDLCTRFDRCQDAVCMGFDPVVCPPPEPCHKQGSCDRSTGICDTPLKDDGASCDSDGDPCTVGDRCMAGECRPGSPKDCGGYACDEDTGECRSRCGSVLDCVDGKVCDRERECVDAPPDRHHEDRSGCAVSPRAALGGSPWPPAALALLALGAGRRRGHRRAGGLAPSCVRVEARIAGPGPSGPFASARYPEFTGHER
jgi:Galactose oxidase, central domain